MASDITKRLYTGFVFALLLVISVGVLFLVTLKKQNVQGALIKKTYQVINQLEIIQRTVIDMETGLRGFRASNDKKFLQPYNESLEAIEPAFKKLFSLINDNSSQVGKASIIKSKVDDLLQFWSSLSFNARTYNVTDIIQVGTIEKNKMDGIRVEIESMKSSEDILLADRERANSESIKTARRILIAGILIIMITVIALISQIIKEFKKRRTVENDLQNNYNKLSLLHQQENERNEMLENQKDELRQTNEELSLKAAEMQATEEELRLQEEKLRKINAELKDKNKALEHARQALDIKAKELEETNKYKSEFLANMSHELRTPLNSVLILAKLLSDNANNNLTDKQVAHARIIHKSGSDLLRLINNILDLSKIEAGKAEVYLDNTLISIIAADIDQLFTVVAEEKNITYSITIEADAPEVIRTDKQKVEQILKNLLSNAFKFTLKNGRVELVFSHAIENGSQYLLMNVKDNGIGIPENQQQIIFNAFQQADGAINRKYGGTGLGLSITKELVRLLNGKISVESKQGEGSTFTVLIPVDNKPSHVAGQGSNKGFSEITLPDNIVEQTVIKDDRHTLEKDDKIMLIIEDDEDFATLIKGFASKKGYKTIIALKGDEGLLCAKKYHPSAIILDMGLPIIDGTTLLQTFKKEPSLKNIPVHIISASEDIKFGNSGALAFLKKPIDRQNIDKAFTLIEEYLHSSVKRVLLFSTDELKNDVLDLLIQEKNYDIKYDMVASVKEALDKLASVRYDCIVADIRTDVEERISQLRYIYEQLLPRRIPTIIYLDEGISEANEIRLRKMANVIVRRSTLSDNRLMNELELFLYKVEGENSKEGLSNIFKPIVHDLHKKKVLLVDDDMRNIFALTAALEQEQMEIFTAIDGKEAMQILENNKQIDIVLMDIMMPEMDGYAAIETIRNSLHLKKLPVIALTAKAMSGDKEKCLKAGASDYITKPVEIQQLVSLMRGWLS